MKATIERGEVGEVATARRTSSAVRRTRRPPTRLTLAHAAMITAGLATFVTVGSVLTERGAMVEVLVVAGDTASGTASSEIEVRTLAVRSDSAFLDSLVRPGELPPGMVLGHHVVAGSPLRQSDLVASGATVLHRTASVAVESVSIVGLGLVAGDRVDVIGLDSNERPTFVLIDVRVARLPDSVGPDGLLSGPSGSFVTVEVDDAQALALVAAQRRGPIELLRSTGAPPVVDQTTVDQTTVEEAS